VSRPSDTSAAAQKIVDDVLRTATPSEKIGMVVELIEAAESISASGIRLRHPTYTDREVQLAIIRLRLGSLLFCEVYPHHTDIHP
jgi:hypothetical protein